jgi:asparagine synthase (glutamine-hydrolysing)
MCSIFAMFDFVTDAESARRLAFAQSHLMHHRGPDSHGVYASERAVLVHNRISVVDVFRGGQPLLARDGKVALVANAEIYNHAELRRELEGYDFRTDSDCEAILALYLERGPAALDDLRGMFAFAVHDSERGRYCIARDHIGILSLYYGRDAYGALYVASELKALQEICVEFHVFPPGHYLTESTPEPVPYYERAWRSYDVVATNQTNPKLLRAALEEAVASHLMSDVGVGLLLSGGLDSSLIASIAVSQSRQRGLPIPPSYSIGLEDSPDLAHARDMAAYLGTNHHEFVYTVEEGIDAIRNTIYHLESYDVTSVRASTPMHMIARRIRGNGTKVVLTGDGSDEAFAGYLYFHKAPDARALHEECVRKLEMMHLYDCLRVNKTLLSWGVEPRVPFLDKRFLDVAMSINPQDKMCGPERMEKQILRETFADYLPASVTWRQKEQSSDGVGYGWIGSLKALAERQVTDSMLSDAAQRFAHNTPTSKEGYMYRALFQELFPHPSASRCAPGGKTAGNATSAASLWLGGQLVDDPSGRSVIGVHANAFAR